MTGVASRPVVGGEFELEGGKIAGTLSSPRSKCIKNRTSQVSYRLHHKQVCKARHEQKTLTF
jgi:hypothetical protein